MDNATASKLPISSSNSFKPNIQSQQHKETLQKLLCIDFTSLETKNALDYLDKSMVGEYLIRETSNQVNDLERITQVFNKETIKKQLDESLNNDIETLISKSNSFISNLYKLSSNCKSLSEEHSEIIHNLTEKDNSIKEMLENYSDYLKKNKNYLVRNEILKNFIEKISITKEEKDNLVDKSNFNQVFFSLIDKLIQIKNNIQIIDRNKDNFSKNLLFSIKENSLLIEDLMNEKIFIFLKSIFRSSKTANVNEIKNIKKALSFIYKKENYLNYILKEYTQFRKKFLDESLKKRYISITNTEELLYKLIEDFKNYFIKEVILLHYFFGNPKEDINLHIILQMFNNTNQETKNQAEYEEFFNSFKSSFKQEKLDFSSFVSLLNVILFSFEQTTYESFKKAINISQSPDNLSKVYNITMISYLYCFSIEKFSEELSISSLENLSLYGFLINNKKSLSKTLAKSYSDFGKSVIVLKTNFKKFLSSNDFFITDSSSDKGITSLFEEFSKIVKTYHSNYAHLNSKDRENLNPKLNNQSFKVLFEFFEGLDVLQETNIQTTCKLVNLIQNIINKFKIFENFEVIEDELNNLKLLLEKAVKNCVNLVHSAICKQTNFTQENLSKLTTYEQMINLIEYILDTSN